MKTKLLRFCGSMAVALLVGALPLILLWQRADAAQREGLVLERRSAESSRRSVREKRSTVAQQIARLESAPTQLSAESFLDWETFCKEQPWELLRPLLEKRMAQHPDKDEVRSLLLIRWAGENGSAAAAWVKEYLPDKRVGYPDAALDHGAIGATWAWTDPAGFSAVQKAASPEERIADAWYLCSWLAKRDSALAFEIFRKPHDPTNDWTSTAADLITPFLKTPAEAATLLELITKEKHENHDPPVNWLTRVLRAWADMDEAGALAAAQAVKWPETRSLKEELTHYIMRGRPQTEATADEWMQRLPDGVSNHAMKDVIKGLMSVDMAAAGRWLLKQPPSFSVTMSMREYLKTLAFRDPAAALTYADALPDAGRRDEFVSQVVAQWADGSPAAATEMLQSQGWSDERIAQLKDRMAVEHPEAALWWWDW